MDALRPEETLTKNISATSPQIHKALNKTATEGGGSDTVSCSWNHLDKVEMVLLAPPLPWDSASFSIKQWFSGVYPGNTSPGQVAGTEHPHYLAPVTWDQPLCARASHLNPAVNTCWPLIARAKGQKEKNRCIPELSNNFRWGVGSASRSCAVKLLNINKRDLTDIPCVQMRHWIGVEPYNCGPAERDHFRKTSGGIKDWSNQPAAPPGLKEWDQTHNYNVSLKWSSNGSSWDHRFTSLLCSCLPTGESSE